MSNRFFSLCLAVLLISNIYFYNYLFLGQDISLEEVYIGVFLNQSIHLLLFAYLLLSTKIPLKRNITILVLVILSLDFLNEIINISTQNTELSPIIDSSIVGLQRILWTVIFAIEGGRLFTNNKLKNLLNIAFASFMIYSFMVGFGYAISYPVWVEFLHVVLFGFVIVASNTNKSFFHFIGLGALFIAIGDLAYIYSGFHNDSFHRYLYLVPRVLIGLGELMIIHKLFAEKQTNNSED